MFACWQTYWYFNVISNISQQKNDKKALFLAAENTEDSEIFLDRIDTVFFRHGLTRIPMAQVHTDSSIVISRGYIWHKLAGIKGKELKNLCQSLGCPLRHVQGRL
jgi:hypothetical protein